MWVGEGSPLHQPFLQPEDSIYRHEANTDGRISCLCILADCKEALAGNVLDLPPFTGRPVSVSVQELLEQTGIHPALDRCNP